MLMVEVSSDESFVLEHSCKSQIPIVMATKSNNVYIKACCIYLAIISNSSFPEWETLINWQQFTDIMMNNLNSHYDFYV